MKIKRTKIAKILKNTPPDVEVIVKGWVRTKRGNKQVNFISLNDGSTLKNIQVVADPALIGEEVLKNITTV